MKWRVMVLHIENLTKSLFRVIQVDLLIFLSGFICLFHREINTWDEQKSNGDAYWELDQISLSTSQNRHLISKIEEITLFVLVFHWVILGNSKSSTSKYAVQEYEAEKRIAEEIMQTVLKLGLPFKLDQLTEGLGNCFPI